MIFTDCDELGRIKLVYEVSDDQAEIYREQGFVEVIDPPKPLELTDYYIDLTSSKAKLRVEPPISRAGGVIRGIPVPARMIVMSGVIEEFQVSESEIELDVDEPGQYRIEIIPDAPQYRAWVYQGSL